MPHHVDPERPHDPAPFNRPEGYSGQGYRPEDEAAIGARTADPPAPAPDGHPDLPSDNGARASVDPVTGEVHGSGMGDGGGQDGEDFDSSSSSGDSFPLTGGEGTDKTPGDLGPAPRDETSYL